VEIQNEGLELEIYKSKVQGTVNLSGAKNSALKLLVASLLTDDDIIFYNFPSKLLDVVTSIQMLKKIGKSIDLNENWIKIKSSKHINSELQTEVREHSIRTTPLILGALLARKGYGKVPLPGGCKIGERKYDLHVMVLEKMGARIWEEDNYLVGEVQNKLKGAVIELPIRSTGATENAIIAGVLAEGTTVLFGPHIRPEILDLVKFLRSMGANITVRGQESIVVEGVNFLHGASHTVISDSVEALTFVVAALITGGEIEISNFPFNDLEVPLIFLRESGGRFFRNENSLIVKGGECFPLDISTGPFPGINSDMQPIFAIIGLMAKGISKIIDLRFPGRYAYVEELQKMGGRFKINGNILMILGPCQLKGTEVRALDLRCGAALILAGLVADGCTRIVNAWQILRGYEEIDKKFQELNAKVYLNKK